MRTYQAPTDFRAVKTVGDRGQTAYVIKADGYAFASLEFLGGTLWVFRSEIARELDLRDGILVSDDKFDGFLKGLKAPFLTYDRYCFEECEADLETERRAEQTLEYFAPHAADTDWEDSMGMS